jgi:hypothetical protein
MTPKWVVEIARESMGGIDLDPCSTDEANARVEATTYYALSEGGDGLTLGYFGNVFMNPPYSKGLIDAFVEKFLAHWGAGEIKNGFIITNNVTETRWAQELAKSCSAVWLLAGRVHFIEPGGKEARETRQGQLVWFYTGDPVALARFSVLASSGGVVFYPGLMRGIG